ncbi:D-aminoacylase [Oscillatoria amoena NRMC-F 0135]|nr:D-aminoacylase [Oscillatoria amoena NRMC-F 0135]
MKAIPGCFFLMTIVMASFGQSYDLLIVNGKIIDGTGNSWFYGDVGVKDGKISGIGRLDRSKAERILDATGLIVAPGFIDVHTHIEGSVLDVPTAGNFIMDGVTSVVTGNCGGSAVNVKRFFEQLDSVRTSLNIATLIGHNTVRRAVIGDEQRDPTRDEQRRMEELVDQGMRNGAVGLSTGLIYIPGTYSKTEEVVGLAKVAAKFGGVYASHIRDEGDRVTEAVEEAINIGRQANLPVQISHFKVTYKPNWGKSVGTIAQVDRARVEGIDVTIDQYPYIASSTTLSTTVPSWVFGGGRDSVTARLSDPKTREKIKHEMADILKKKQLKSYSYAVVARYAPDSTFNGKNISEINRIRGRKTKPLEEAETILELVASTERVQMVYFSMNETDLRRIAQYPFNMFASDAGINKFGSGMPHPRAYGTNSKVLGTYVRDLKIVRLEEAIRRMTSLPATKFNLRDRGLLREGMAADIVVFDERTVGDRATFERPHAYAFGFKHVMVNGKVTVEDGKHTGVRNGVVLKGPGTQ